MKANTKKKKDFVRKVNCLLKLKKNSQPFKHFADPDRTLHGQNRVRNNLVVYPDFVRYYEIIENGVSWGARIYRSSTSGSKAWC